jgi:hypothetical protein
MSRGTEVAMSRAALPTRARRARVVNFGDRAFVGFLTAVGLCILAVAGVILLIV